ncbi:hypothetical protein DFR29_1233 [Tahibacter aquaticus]|uniref:Tetratricopeptide repeat protein n=1 Tax=Tahibacter aquaticus TaxID=520092 RepID=A0A4R6YL45_9GAMM|nr:hypothetical protein [Tahibacter aquaticus]TDR37829.1 hypothetical protein DFR29_1233 [Tahibacter aquaticus]
MFTVSPIKPWFASPDWGEAVETDFRARLKRSRKKRDYLRAKAGALAPRWPHAALGLLAEYQAIAGGDAFASLAPYYEGVAYRALGDWERAIDCWARALAMEYAPDAALVKSPARLDYVYWVGALGLASRFDHALSLIGLPGEFPVFPSEVFRETAGAALMLQARGQRAMAKDLARQALVAAAAKTSGFYHHPALGLVSGDHADVCARLAQLAAEDAPPQPLG